MIEKRESTAQQLLNIRDCIRWGASRFAAAGLYFGHGSDNAWDEASYLVLHTLHLPWDSSPQVLDARLTLEERRQVLAVLDRRIGERIPAAYITGEAWFAGLRFHIDRRVLVPRSPLAELIERGFQPWLAGEPGRILDLCTGSGCIGIACAAAFPGAEVELSDISGEALVVARQNIELHQLQQRVSSWQGDLFAAVGGRRYELIVANPPYVDAEDLAAMPPEYRAEPALGLASGADGLDLVRRLLAEAADHLSPGGLLVVEVGNTWPALERAYPGVDFTWVEFERGGHGVFVLGEAQLQAHRADFSRAAYNAAADNNTGS